MFKHELLFKLRDCILDKSIKLSSGKESNFYIDCRKLSLSRVGAKVICNAVCEKINEIVDLTGTPIHTLAAEGVGGTAIAHATMGHHVLIDNLLIVRSSPKLHGTQSSIEGASNVKSETPIILVEDVVTTGNSVIKAAKILEESNYIVNAIVALVDREEGADRLLSNLNYNFFPILKRSDFK
jgi:orotate phosphoribosyltransferase